MARTSPDRRLLLKYKGDKCLHCGETVEELNEAYGDVACLFEFNHVDPSKKHPDYHNLIRRKLSAEQLDEVDKCVLLCNKCHRILHAQNGKAKLTLTVAYKGNYKRTQEVEGVCLLNRVTGRLAFFTDQRIEITPYAIRKGTKRSEVVSWGDLYHGLLTDAINNIRKFRKMAVFDRRGHLVFEARLKGTNSCEVVYDVKSDFLQGELLTHDGQTVYLRSGRMVVPPDTVSDDGMLTMTLNCDPMVNAS